MLPDFEFIIPWNTQLHNFEFGDGKLNVVWRAYGIVSGKRFVVDKNKVSRFTFVILRF